MKQFYLKVSKSSTSSDILVFTCIRLNYKIVFVHQKQLNISSFHMVQPNMCNVKSEYLTSYKSQVGTSHCSV